MVGLLKRRWAASPTACVLRSLSAHKPTGAPTSPGAQRLDVQCARAPGSGHQHLTGHVPVSQAHTKPAPKPMLISVFTHATHFQFKDFSAGTCPCSRNATHPSLKAQAPACHNATMLCCPECPCSGPHRRQMLPAATAGSRVAAVQQGRGAIEAGPNGGRLVPDGGLPALVPGPLLDTSPESAKSRPHRRAHPGARCSASGPWGMREAVRRAVPTSHPRPVSGPGPQGRQGRMEVTGLWLGLDSSWGAAPFSVRPAHTEY